MAGYWRALLRTALFLTFISGPLLPKAFADSSDLETGRDIFYKHCKACHGDKGNGKTFAANVLNPPPKNFTAEKSKKELKYNPKIGIEEGITKYLLFYNNK